MGSDTVTVLFKMMVYMLCLLLFCTRGNSFFFLFVDKKFAVKLIVILFFFFFRPNCNAEQWLSVCVPAHRGRGYFLPAAKTF